MSSCAAVALRILKPEVEQLVIKGLNGAVVGAKGRDAPVEGQEEGRKHRADVEVHPKEQVIIKVMDEDPQQHHAGSSSVAQQPP